MIHQCGGARKDAPTHAATRTHTIMITLPFNTTKTHGCDSPYTHVHNILTPSPLPTDGPPSGGKKKKVPQPNEKAHKAEVEDLTKQIETLQAELVCARCDVVCSCCGVNSWVVVVWSVMVWLVMVTQRVSFRPLSSLHSSLTFYLTIRHVRDNFVLFLHSSLTLS